jgi:murein DD-endopeptidase MepM/ murein hydrolase activator NlpD
VSLDIGSIVERARTAAAEAQRDGKTSGTEREELKRIAAEFESMLLVQMLKDMRKSGSWDTTEEQDTYGAETLFETLDLELANHLAKVKGMGLQEELVGAFDRMQPKPPTTESAPAAVSPVGSPVSGLRSSVGTPASSVVTPSVATPETRGQKRETAFVKPVSGAVTSDFGWRRDPFTSRLKFHQGVDMKAAYGQEVQAAGGGRVVFSGEQGGYGTSVVIEHQDGTRTRYAHLSAALVAKGDDVSAGAAVGRAGKSGRATGTHLHFEVIGRDGKRVPPQQWASADTAGRALPGMEQRRTERAGD